MAKSNEKKKVFVVGHDPYNLDLMKHADKNGEWDLLPTVSWEQTQPASGRFDFDWLVNCARATIEESGGKPDAIVGYLDFPTTAIVSVLSKEYGLPFASPEAVAKIEHKYWMRLIQKKVMPESTPKCVAINPFDVESAKKNAPAFPFWLKPVKGHSSILGFLVEKQSDFDKALHECRQKIHLFGEPFSSFLDHVEGTDELNGVDGNFAVAESLISAERQFTLEGYMQKGEITIYGAIDSKREGAANSSLSRYQYPGDIPEHVVEMASKITHKLLREAGYDNAPFNVEFFWDPETDALNILEINARISKSHSPLFKMVDGISHHKVAVDLSMGRKPQMPYRKGKDAIASKFMFRSYESDGLITRVPTEKEVSDLKRILPDIEVNILAEHDVRLSEMPYQESYSYELADIFLGGSDEEMIEDAYVRSVDSLEFRIKPLPAEL